MIIDMIEIEPGYWKPFLCPGCEPEAPLPPAGQWMMCLRCGVRIMTQPVPTEVQAAA